MTLSASVVICTHDRPEPLRRSVAAVLAQTRPPMELIVVNDGREDLDDRPAEAARAAGVAFAAIRRHEPGLPASRNRGMGAAAGDVVLLLDDDMLMPPDYLAELLALYEADPDGRIAGIGATAENTTPAGASDHLWALAAGAMGAGRWCPRRWAAGSAPLPAALRGRLVPARRLSGGTISLRREVAAVERFDEGLGAYALGEDREFCYRVGMRRALFLATGLKLVHDKSGPGRPDPAAMGRMYVRNTLRIAARATDGGAGTALLVGCELVGTMLLHLLYVPLSRPGHHAGFAAGMLSGLARWGRQGVRRMLCGS